jgi:hypothetical protein
MCLSSLEDELNAAIMRVPALAMTDIANLTESFIVETMDVLDPPIPIPGTTEVCYPRHWLVKGLCKAGALWALGCKMFEKHHQWCPEQTKLYDPLITANTRNNG